MDLRQSQAASELIFFVYPRTLPGALLRQMVIHAVTRLEEDELHFAAHNKHEWTHEALWELSEALMKVPRPPCIGFLEYGEVDLCPLFHRHEGILCNRRNLKRSRGQMEKGTAPFAPCQQLLRNRARNDYRTHFRFPLSLQETFSLALPCRV